MSSMSRKEAYDRMIQESALSWWKLYEEEKTKRIEAEAKYERLTRKIKENAIKEVSQREIDDWYEPGKIYPAVDFGAGLIPVQHKMKDEPYTLTNYNAGQREEFWDNLKELVKEDDTEEWDEDRIDIIGQNGNTGDHYEDEEFTIVGDYKCTSCLHEFEAQEVPNKTPDCPKCGAKNARPIWRQQ